MSIKKSGRGRRDPLSRKKTTRSILRKKEHGVKQGSQEATLTKGLPTNDTDSRTLSESKPEISSTTTESSGKQPLPGESSTGSSGTIPGLSKPSNISEPSTKGPTGEELRNLLWETMRDVKAGLISPESAVAIGRMSKEILSSVKSERTGGPDGSRASGLPIHKEKA